MITGAVGTVDRGRIDLEPLRELPGAILLPQLAFHLRPHAAQDRRRIEQRIARHEVLGEEGVFDPPMGVLPGDRIVE